MPMNKLHLSPQAQNDLSEIKDYIAHDLENPEAAQRTVRRITKELRILQTFAFAGAPLSSIVDIHGDYRFLTSGNYLAFYRVRGTDVYVDRILYGRSDYLRTLFGDLPEEDVESERGMVE